MPRASADRAAPRARSDARGRPSTCVPSSDGTRGRSAETSERGRTVRRTPCLRPAPSSPARPEGSRARRPARRSDRPHPPSAHLRRPAPTQTTRQTQVIRGFPDASRARPMAGPAVAGRAAWHRTRTPAHRPRIARRLADAVVRGEAPVQPRGHGRIARRWQRDLGMAAEGGERREPTPLRCVHEQPSYLPGTRSTASFRPPGLVGPSATTVRCPPDPRRNEPQGTAMPRGPAGRRRGPGWRSWGPPPSRFTWNARQAGRAHEPARDEDHRLGDTATTGSRTPGHQPSRRGDPGRAFPWDAGSTAWCSPGSTVAHPSKASEGRGRTIS